MIIKSVTLKNFGLYLGEHTVSFDNISSSKPITLIGGLNGRGKTTFLDAIILGLYGHRALKYLQDERIRYSRYLENRVNKSAVTGSETSITITLMDSETGSDQISIKRYWYNTGLEPVERFDAYRNKVYDEYLSHNWDYFVEEILPLNVSRFFFFDSEKIAQIADDESFDSVKESIRALLGLTTIEQLTTDLSRLIKKKSQQVSEHEQSDFMDKLEVLQARLEENEQDSKAAYDDAAHYQLLISQAQNHYDQEQDLFWKAGGNLGLDKGKIEETRDSQNRVLEECMLSAKEQVQDAALPLLICRPLLTRTLDYARKNQEVRFSRMSSDLIAQLKTMLQESDYSDKRKKQTLSFLENAENQLAISRSDLSVYTLSEEAVYQLRRLIDSADERIAALSQILLKLHKTKEKLVQIEDHLSREVSETAAQIHWNRMLDLSETMMANEVNQRVSLERYDRLQRERITLERQHAHLLSDNMQNAMIMGENQRVYQYAAVVTSVMSEFKRRIQQKRVADLQNVILKCFRSMVGKESMIDGIEISSDTLDIKLIDYAGGELLKSQLSAGEKQLFAVSILWGLAQCSGYNMPVIIDTPLGRLDSQHRTNFVEGYLPYAGCQVIVLSTDEEINGKYLDLIEAHVNSTYTLIYDEARHCTSVTQGYFGGDLA